MPRLYSFLLCALSGILLFLAFPPVDQGFLVWVGLVPLFAVLWRGDRPTRFRDHLKNAFCGFLCGLFFYGGSFWWINEVSTLGYIPVTCYLALYPAVWAWLVGGPLRPKQIPFCPKDSKNIKPELSRWSHVDMGRTILAAVFAASAWVVLEWLRGYGPFAFGWNSLGVAFSPVLAQPAEWIGATGLSFFPVLVSAILWNSGRRVVSTVVAYGKRSAQWDFLAAMGIIALLFVWGTWKSAYHDRDVKDKTTPLRVLVVQENRPQFIRWTPESRTAALQTQLDNTAKAVRELHNKSLENSINSGTPSKLMKPDWVIWPESAITWPFYHVEGSPVIKDQPIFSFNDDGWTPFSKEEGPFTLFAGVDEVFYSPESMERPSRLHNSLRTFNGDFASQSRVYRKRHLVPFGEYIPFRDSLPLLEKAFAYSSGVSMGSNFTPGTSKKPLEIPTREKTISVIPSICFEDTLPSLARASVDTKYPQVILNITNDGWFNKSWAAEQHFRNARLRSIELRRPMVRAGNTGVSAVISADGTTYNPLYADEGIRELRDSDSKTFHKGYLFATLDLPNSPKWTLYAQWGDWFVLQCGLLLLFGLLRPYLKRSERGSVKNGVYVPSRLRNSDK